MKSGVFAYLSPVSKPTGYPPKPRLFPPKFTCFSPAPHALVRISIHFVKTNRNPQPDRNTSNRADDRLMTNQRRVDALRKTRSGSIKPMRSQNAEPPSVSHSGLWSRYGSAVGVAKPSRNPANTSTPKSNNRPIVVPVNILSNSFVLISLLLRTSC